MNVYSQLVKADLENLATDPTTPSTGRIWYNTTDKQVKIFDGTNINVVLISGGNSFDTNNYLISTDFPNTTSLYGWHINGASDYDDGDWIGSQALTENGTGLTSSTNHLGATAFCNFNGTDDYLSNTDATFDTADEDFTVGAWIKPDDWTTGTYRSIMSKWEQNGNKKSFVFTLTSNDQLSFFISYDGENYNELSFSITQIDDGYYHHVVAGYNYVSANESYMYLYVDGLLVRSIKNGSGAGSRYNSSDSELKIGAYSNTNPTGFFAGDITEVFYKKECLTAEQVKKIYARGSRLAATVKPDGNIDINLPLEGVWLSYTPSIYKADGTTAITPTLVLARYSVVKDSVVYKLSLGGVPDPSGSAIEFTTPIIALTTTSGYPYSSGAFVYQNGIVAGYLAIRGAATYKGFFSAAGTFSATQNQNEASGTITYPWR
jgi:hypothetical protein